ncbi:MAG: cytochrome c3 family protein [Planctomycetota bacterium]
MPRAPVIVVLLFLAPAAVVLALVFGPDPVALEAARPLIERAHEYVGSDACRACHLDQHASWERTFHRTMTQRAEPGAVLGDFDGVARAFFGASAVPFERDGRFWMRVPDGAGGAREAEVALCVGSRRYQQYFELAGEHVGDTYRRLPLVWHVEEERWGHVNGLFLEPDSDDWSAHASSWNGNCIFCHNTGPEPRLVEPRTTSVAAQRSDSRVGELGIACEACHGPGRAHVELLSDPRARLAPPAELRIVNPSELPARAASALCGQCHSQRLPREPEALWTFLASGPTFRPGDALENHVTPVTRDTPSPDPRQPELFRARFWSDGTARLTAYEYLGLTQSPCFAGGEFSCLSCHSLHAGDPRGNLTDEMRGDGACTQCHAGFATRAHHGHDPDRAGGRCLDCHMPRIVYGVLEVHRSHRVESPDVRRDVEGGRPNACTLCHAEKTAAWAAGEFARIFGGEPAPPRARPDGAPLEVPELLASLHAGDALQRAVAARALGEFAQPERAAFVVPNLVATLGDGYPSVRTLALRALGKLDVALELGLGAELAAFDPLASLEERGAALPELLLAAGRQARAARVRPPPASTLVLPMHVLDLERVRALLELQSDHVISIGE